MSELIDRLEKEWDMVILDSPPLIAVTDASMVSKEIDKVILVVQSGVTERKAFERGIDILSNIQAPFGGVILNELDAKSSYGYYYYYYQYYYSSEDRKRAKVEKRIKHTRTHQA